MPRAEFEATAPGEIAALREAWLARVRREDFRAAVLAQILLEANRDRSTRAFPFDLGEIFPSLAEDDDEEEGDGGVFDKFCAAFKLRS